jgi:hypothetical protein
MVPMTVAGVDGCRGGWVVVTTMIEGDGSTVERLSDLGSVMSRLDAGELAAVGKTSPSAYPRRVLAAATSRLAA